ncbi:MAG: pilus assembly PilX N-terminal domain-containing protein [Gammaproteobacteria bacterium]|nr:pilus assembly PilX N-terminal domain-containing protein [Gammaproteobacteria bacterium]
MNVTNQSFKRNASPLRLKKQTGVVLVMALIMLLVLTIIGVSSMGGSTLEMKVAGNMQQRNIAFQATQSRLAFAGSSGAPNPVDYLIPIPDTSNPPVQTCNPTDSPPCPDGPGWVATAEVIYLSCAKGSGNSLEAGKGVSYRTFEIKANGQTPTGSSRSVQVSAMRYPVKGCGDEML